ncbi:MAG: hypothetical protein JST80_07885 [Bdellovibrionales bacterium]|nr:hypothetical protein [Bdellovibrionales bacterium]
MRVIQLWSIVYMAAAILMLSACSNPFSGSRDHGSLYHTPNANCQTVRFDSGDFDVKQLRSLIHCLNSNGQIQELENLTNELTDNQMSGLAMLANLLSHEQTRSLYSIESAYQRIRIKKIFESVFAELRDIRISPSLTKAAPIVTDFIFDSNVRIYPQNIQAYFNSKALKRLIDEHVDGKDFDDAIRFLDQYLNSAREFDLSGLYAMLTRNKVTLPTQLKSLESTSAFFDSIFGPQNFNGFSSTIETIVNNPITCFQNSTPIHQPIEVATKRLFGSSSSEAREFFNSNLRSLLMTARGYCTISYSLEPLFKFTDPLISHHGFDAAYRMLLPLIRDKSFVTFLSRPATRNWTIANAFLSKQHTFQDLFTLLSLHDSLPITSNGTRTAKYMDRLFVSLDGGEVLDLFRSLGPALTRVNSTPILDAYLETPDLELKDNAALKAGLKTFTLGVLQSNRLPAVLDMIHRLSDQNEIAPLIDQIFVLFHDSVQKGRHPLTFEKRLVPGQTAVTLKNTLLNKNISKYTPSACSNVDSDYALTTPSLRKTPTWAALDACFGDDAASRATLKTGKAFSDYLNTKGRLEFFTQLESDLIQGAFKTDVKASMDVVSHFTGISDSDSAKARQAILLGSSVTRLVGPSIKQSSRLREIVAAGVESPLLYQGLAEMRANTKTSPRQKALEFDTRTTFETWTAAGQMRALPLVTGITAIVQEYCTSLDTQDKNCDLDDDQVLLFRQNPERLAAQVIVESLTRNQTWLHPTVREWSQTGTDEVQDFTYHYHPFLHEMRSSKKAGESLFSFFRGYSNHIDELQHFMRVSAAHYSLIPYVYQLPGYPRSSKHEYHNRIRIRLVSDLDRLELIAINTDFKAFGLVKNLGMKFIRDIALSWGDDSARPAGSTSTTLAATTAAIKTELRKFDKGIIQKAGQCDPRGKSRFGRWLQSTLCNSELSDLSARLFNLRFLVPLLDVMQPREAGGTDGLRVLRNLFYALYASTPSAQSDKFSNGVDLPASCLRAPDQTATPRECKFDHLTLISRITRLGLLHEAGLSVAFNPESSVNDTLSTLVRISNDEEIKSQFVSWLVTPQSSRTLLSVNKWVNSLPENVNAFRLHQLLKWVSRLEPYHWISSIFGAMNAEPNLLLEFSEPLTKFATMDDVGTSIDDFDHSPAFSKWVGQEMSMVDGRAIQEIARFILALKDKSPEISKLLVEGGQIQDLADSQIRSDINTWLLKLSTPQASFARQGMKHFVLGKDFDTFCDAYSDTDLVGKAYNFLEKIHQNPDSGPFFATCRDFLFH